MTAADVETPGTRSDPITDLREQAHALIERLDGPVRRVVVQSGECSVEVEWEVPVASAGQAAVPYAPPVRDGSATDSTADITGSGDGDDTGSTHSVTAPLVGTFYTASSPGADPYVKVGDVVEPGQQVAIIEAMKLMNPITVEQHARVIAIHAGDGQMVEFGERLMDLAAVE